MEADHAILQSTAQSQKWKFVEILLIEPHTVLWLTRRVRQSHTGLTRLLQQSPEVRILEDTAHRFPAPLCSRSATRFSTEADAPLRSLRLVAFPFLALAYGLPFLSEVGLSPNLPSAIILPPREGGRVELSCEYTQNPRGPNLAA